MVAERIANDVYGGFMQSALDALMGIASGAVGMLQQAINQSSPKSGFDDQLQAALAEPSGEGKTLLDKLQAAKDSTNDDLKALVANPQALPLLQYISILSSLGLNSTDAKALLSGMGSDISDEGLKSILASCGINDADITQLMTDPNLTAGLKDKLAETVSTTVHQELGSTDLDKMVEQLTEDQQTFDATVSAFIARSGISQGLDSTKSDPSTSNNKASAETKALAEIMRTVNTFLKDPETAPAKNADPGSMDVLKAQIKPVSSEQVVSDTVTQPMPEVLEAAATLENTFNIPKKTLQDLFFSTDTQVRQAALDDATSHILDYLKANGGKDLPKQVTGALSLLKGTLSKDEFVKVEDVFKSVNPDLASNTQPFTFDKNVLQTLAKSFGDEPAIIQSRYTDSVMDQMKQAIPGGIKSSEGSMTLKLNPPMLGRVDVNIKLEDGQITASFKVDQSVTRDILQQNMHILKDALTDQGIKATQFVVTTDTFDSRDHQGNPLAWAGYEPGQNGSSRQQGSQQDTADPGKGRDEYFNGYTPVQGYSEQGGLDIFA